MKGALKNFFLVIVLFVTVFAIPISASVAEAQTTPTNTGLSAGFILFDRSQTSSGLSLDPATGNLIVTRQNNQTPLIIPAGSAVSSNQGTTVTFTKIEGAVIYTYVIRKNTNGVNELIDATREDTAAMDEKGGGGPVRTYFYDQAQGKLAAETDPQIARAYQILKNGSASLVAGFNQTPQATQLAQQLASPTEPKPEGDATTCNPSMFSAGSWITGACIMRIFAVIADAILRGTSYVLYFAGTFFDAAISYTVVNMKSNFDSFTSVGVIWSLIRDIVNICFIFVMIAISIGTILQLSTFNVKQLLAKVILAALIMNFSLFYTKVMIDASNIVTLAFYSKMTVNDSQNGRPADGGLSAAFLNTLRIGSIYSRTAGSQALDTLSNQTNAQLTANGNTAVSYGLSSSKYWDIILVSLFGSVALIIVAIAFFSATIMLLFRFFMLIVLLATSVLPIASMILPQTSKLTSRWWNYLSKELLALPVFMIVMYVSFITMKSKAFENLAGVNTGSGTIAAAGFSSIGANSGVGLMNTILSFTFTVALIFGAVIAAQSLGGYGAGLTGVMFKKLNSTFGRNTLGRTAKLAGKTYDRAASSQIMEKTGFGKTLKTLGSLTGINEVLQGARKGFKAGEEYKYGYQSLSDREKELKGIDSRNTALYAEREVTNGIMNYLPLQQVIEQKIKDGIKLEAHEADAKATYEKSLANSSPKQLAALKLEVQKKIAKDLTDDTFAGLLKSDDVKDDETLQRTLRDARTSFIKALIPQNPADAEKFFDGVLSGTQVLTDKQKAVMDEITPEKVKHMGPEFFDTGTKQGQFFARFMPKKAYDAFQDDKNVGAYAKAQFKAQRVEGAKTDLNNLPHIPLANKPAVIQRLKGAISSMDGKTLRKYLKETGVLDRPLSDMTEEEKHVIAAVSQPQLESFEKQDSFDEDFDSFAQRLGGAIRAVGDPANGYSGFTSAYKYVRPNDDRSNKGYRFWNDRSVSGRP